ncbi:Putative prophage phiRv2 integrase [Propionicimonas sp. T2.31MG-18]
MAARSGMRAFGRIRKLPSGYFQAGYVGPDAATHYAPHTFEAKVDAERWLADEHRRVGQPDWLPPKLRRAHEEANLPPTLADYAAGWLRSRDLKPRTRALYQGLLDRFIVPELGSVRLPAVTPTMVRQWHTSLGPNRPTQRAHTYSLLRSILSTAVQEQIIPMNPCLIRGAGAAKRKTVTEPATLDELRVIRENMPERLRLAVDLATWCSLRQGELLELRRGDVDIAAALLHVRRAVTRLPGEPPLVGTTKSAAGVRDIHIPPHVLPAVEHHLSRYVPPAKDSLLFVGRDSGEQLASSTLYRWFYPAREAAGRPDLRWHDLRHTGNHIAGAAGATLADQRYRMGHSTFAAAMRYQNTAKGRDKIIADEMSKMAGE